MDGLIQLHQLAQKGKSPKSWIDLSSVERRIKDHIALIKLFIKHGADPSIAAKNGKSAIELAEEAQRDDLISLLNRNRP